MNNRDQHLGPAGMMPVPMADPAGLAVAGMMPVPTPGRQPAVPARSAAAGQSRQAPQQTNKLAELESKKKDLMKELGQVEKQIYDLESAFLENSVGIGQALRGYPLTLTPGSGRRPSVKVADRLFSRSSVTGPLE